LSEPSSIADAPWDALVCLVQQAGGVVAVRSPTGALVAGTPMDPPGRRVGLAGGYALDLSHGLDRRAADAATRLARSMATAVVEAPGVVLRLGTDPETRIVHVGSGVVDLFDEPAELLLDEPVQRLVSRAHPLDRPAVVDLIDKVRGSELHEGQVIFRVRAPDGRLRWIDCRLRVGRGARRRGPRPVDALLLDVTASREAEEGLRSARRREGALLAALPDGLLRVRGDGRVLDVRGSARRLPTGLRGLMVGARLRDGLDDEELGLRLERAVSRAIATGQAESVTLPATLDDGGRHWEAKVVRGQLHEAVVLVQDVSQREAMVGELVRARQTAEAASQAKSRFLANVSHEIRTPLNGVLGMAQLLLTTELNAEQRDLAETVRSSGDLLLAVLNDVLDFSKIEAGRLDLEEVRFDAVEVIETTAELLAAGAHEKGLELVCDVDPDLPPVGIGDPHRLRQVLVNLVSNAVKFTATGSVSIHAHADEDGSLVVAVQDTGVGISESARKRLFQPFTQADASTTRRFGGTGLGLAICRELCELMGGGVEVQSTVGAGSRFTFTLPLCLEPGRRDFDLDPGHGLAGHSVAVELDAPGTAAVMRRLLGAWGLEIVDDAAAADLVVVESSVPLRSGPMVRVYPWGERPTGERASLTRPLRRQSLHRAVAQALGLDEVLSVPAPAIPAEPPPLRGRVLVAEDNPVNQRVARGMLERLGLDVEVVANGVLAVQAVVDGDFDLVLMDLQMPELDGVGAARAIRALGGDSVQLPIVAMTADAMPGDRRRCLEAGMDGHLPKPVELGQLRACAAQWLTRDRQERRLAG
jgi:signal transduction histidine kinase/ActR/RegA family two-component response regulator